jgi:hypothetical protein
MAGDERVRHCKACNLNVYNLSAMTEREIRSLLAEKKKGRLCARLYQRRDGTVLTQNCPVGLRALTRRLSRVAGAVLSLMLPGLAGTSQAWAQAYTSIKSNDAVLQIEVLDPSGARVAAAAATLTETTRGIRREAKTDKDGRLVLRCSIAGRYSLTVSSPGFQTATRILELRRGQLLSSPVHLDVASIMGEVIRIDPGSPPDKASVPLNPVVGPSRLAPKSMHH